MNDEVSSLSTGINLVPQTTKKPQQVRRALLVAVLVLRWTLLIVGVVGLGVVLYQTYLSVNLENTTTGIDEQLAFIESKQEFQENFLTLQTYANELGTVHAAIRPQSSIFVTLGESTPRVVVLDDLTINGKDVKISGTTTEYPAITDYFVQLSEVGEFKNVQIVSITRPTDEEDNAKILFTISAEIL